MKYTQLHGLTVSQICLGSWHLPASSEKYGDGILKVDRKETSRVVKKAVDLGINFFDTANTYHGTISETHLHPEHSGNAEKILGSCLEGYDRESIVVATKVRAEVARFPNGGGLSRKHISWQIGESLRRLRMKYVDLYQIHWEDQNTPPEETLDILNDLVHRGSVHYTGVSNHSAENMEKMLRISEERGYEKFITMQEPYSIAERDIEKDKVQVARKYGMGLLAYVPLAQGILTGKYLKGIPQGSRASYIKPLREETERLKSIASRVREAAETLQITPAQFSLAWLLRMQRELGITIVPIIGATSVRHIEENCSATEINLPDDVFRSFMET
ncbi:MAG: aldo/keto reductase [Thermoplasmata archaeon]|uniref:Aldo/keto reductase n=1 Tax=Candidatus Sysuiplasma superficiale TaxID=2823368 RepID=A0A8J7YNU8_9ARCH|nr:aldo/keto reductase [Candidatus Sysuiplasma superficiale]MBX8644165.1 aldo/keto reductase [Candidatus Sysuiplasma superficiale]